ncbi:Fe(II)-2OG oxygenase family protein [Sinomonas albida]|uniref:TauD/TfdA family dioxygenase n=1 Tax=Sinomonas albida TaxID=369942 RepID=UPI0010A8581B|nr:TauD/TfdA family dioxygenase [Sinomonas albida]
MLSSNFAELWAVAQKQGWAMGKFERPVSDWGLSFLGSQMGWVAVGTRTGEGASSTLRPTSQGQSRPNSMSAVHGLDAQPLHVDGSHMLRPPDVVTLFSPQPSQTPTRIWKPNIGDLDVDAARNGIFVVGAGRSAFLAPVLENNEFRFDPVIMHPGDDRARKIADYFASESNNRAQAVDWNEPNSILMIANRNVLHGRAAVHEEDRDRTLMRVAFYVGDSDAGAV